MSNNNISRIIDNILSQEAHFITSSNNPNKMSRLEARKARREGRLVKIAATSDLYQDVKTSDFWKYSEKDNGLVRLFRDENGVAEFNDIDEDLK